MRLCGLRSDQGSAPVEFLLLGLPMLAVTLVCWQLLNFGYQRDLALDAAIEGANFAALADQQPQAGSEMARKVLDSVSPGSLLQVRSEGAEVGGFDAVKTRVVAKPKFLFIQLPNIEAVAYAVREIQR